MREPADFDEIDAMLDRAKSLREPFTLRVALAFLVLDVVLFVRAGGGWGAFGLALFVGPVVHVVVTLGVVLGARATRRIPRGGFGDETVMLVLLGFLSAFALSSAAIAFGGGGC